MKCARLDLFGLDFATIVDAVVVDAVLAGNVGVLVALILLMLRGLGSPLPLLWVPDGLSFQVWWFALL